MHRFRPWARDRQALDPWPHSEAGRFHAISLLLVGVALLLLIVEGARRHRPEEAALLALLVGAGIVVPRGWRATCAHPASFLDPSHGKRLGLPVTGADGQRPSSRWASQSRTR